MIDLKKIDFSRLMLPNWDGQRVNCRCGPLGIELWRFHHRFAHRLTIVNGEWQYCGTSTWTGLEVARTYTDRVDKFIVAETARLAAEDEAANFVPVPWQDVEWLDNSGVVVKFYDVVLRAFVARDLAEHRPGNPLDRYRADRRTFPAGYDPTKPRLIDVGWDQIARLECAGCDSFVARGEAAFAKRYAHGAGDQACRYAIDIHTLPPGVPLHVKPPKLEPRPCTREFALAHPGESAMRWWVDDESGGHWSGWYRVGGIGSARYEFRTTASECTVIPDLEVTASDPPLVVGLGVQLHKGVAVVGGDHVCVDDHGRVKFAHDGAPIGDLVIRL